MECNKKDELGITWLGQGGFLFQANGVRLVVDPYLSDSLSNEGMKRSFPPPFTIEELNPDIVCCTHDHPDHFDEQTMIPIYEAYPNCVILGPESVMRHALSLGFNPGRLVTLHENENSYTFNGLRLKAVKAFHTGEHAIGLALEAVGYRTYISGDTMRNEELVPSALDALGGSPDIVMICINGKLGNMDYNDAVLVVRELEPQVAIPMHYGMFQKNTTDPRPFIYAVNKLGIEGLIMDPGRTVWFPTHFSVKEQTGKNNEVYSIV